MAVHGGSGSPGGGTPGGGSPGGGTGRKGGGLLRRAVRTARLLTRRGSEVELLNRSMGFAALGLVALVPLLIVLAAADPLHRWGFALWVVDGMALSGAPAHAVGHLFATPRQAIHATDAFSLAALAFFGLTFATSVQAGYAKIWDLTLAPWHRAWRQGVWSVVLVAYLYAGVQSRGLVPEPVRIAFTLLAGVAFFWWGPGFLLGGRVPHRALLPGAVATMAGLTGLRGFSYLVFGPLIVSNAVSYGPVGAVLIVESWLVGVGFVVFGGALLGRHLHDRRANRRGESPGDGDGDGRTRDTEPPDARAWMRRPRRRPTAAGGGRVGSGVTGGRGWRNGGGGLRGRS